MSEAELFQSMLDRIEALARDNERMRMEADETHDERIRLAREVDRLTAELARLKDAYQNRLHEIGKLHSRIATLENVAPETRGSASVQPIRSGQ